MCCFTSSSILAMCDTRGPPENQQMAWHSKHNSAASANMASAMQPTRMPLYMASLHVHQESLWPMQVCIPTPTSTVKPRKICCSKHRPGVAGDIRGHVKKISLLWVKGAMGAGKQHLHGDTSRHNTSPRIASTFARAHAASNMGLHALHLQARVVMRQGLEAAFSMRHTPGDEGGSKAMQIDTHAPHAAGSQLHTTSWC